MRKRLAILLTAVLLAGCAMRPPLDESFDEARVKESAAAVVALASEGDYEAICALLRADLFEGFDAAALEAAWSPALSASGAFVEIAKLTCYGAADADTGESYAVAVAVCRYAHGQRVYTLSFDHDYALAGLYLK